MAAGVWEKRIHETPIAVVDLETTGLTAGADRVLEASVVRLDPGLPPRLVFDSLVNPSRPVTATEIHGITDADVADAPRFVDIAGNLLEAMAGCVVATYNVYFDIKFLDFEFRNVGLRQTPPHFCLMYLRPMLGLGSRCKLQEACARYGICIEGAHVASGDAMASARLLSCYLDAVDERGVRTFEELASLKRYKFVDSFDWEPLPGPSQFNLKLAERLKSRAGYQVPVDPTRRAMAAYWDTLKTVLADLQIDDDELAQVREEQKTLGLSKEQLRVQHARAFASVMAQFAADQWIDDREARKLKHLYTCLSQLGWAPGE